jgi:hypothetical protein
VRSRYALADAQVNQSGEKNMRIKPLATVLMMIAVPCGVSASVTIRGSSGNGVNSNAPNWLLLGRSHLLTLTSAAKKANVRREIVCINQDVENAMASPTPTLSGSCDSGAYMFVFQATSTSANVNVVISQLAGFDSTNVANYGVMICDSPDNTIELCTNDPTGTHIPNITATTTSTSVTFAVPGTFPTYPAGTTQQGQGLTFFVITQQTTPLSLGLPTVGIK